MGTKGGDVSLQQTPLEVPPAPVERAGPLNGYTLVGGEVLDLTTVRNDGHGDAQRQAKKQAADQSRQPPLP